MMLLTFFHVSANKNGELQLTISSMAEKISTLEEVVRASDTALADVQTRSSAEIADLKVIFWS